MVTTEDLVVEVSDLTTATTTLIQEVVSQKNRLTDAADLSVSKASEALTYRNSASTHSTNAAYQASVARAEADAAKAEAAKAAIEAGKATEVSGLGSVQEAVDYELNNRGYIKGDHVMRQIKTTQGAIQTQSLLGKLHPLY